MKTKICNRCKIEKLISEFGKHQLHSDGLQSYCKICKRQIDKKYRKTHKEKRKLYIKIHKKILMKQAKDYYRLHKEKIKERRRKYYQSHKQESKNYNKQYNQIHKKEISIKMKKYKKTYYQEHKEDINKYHKNRLKTDINFRIRKNLSDRLLLALKRNSKKGRTLNLLGCSIDFLKKHLEFKFKSGMSWANYGKWHIDHIKPCSSFDLINSSEQRKCFHYTNLQPLWAEENWSKGSKLLIIK